MSHSDIEKIEAQIQKRIKSLTDERDILLLKEKQAEVESDQLAFNSEASNLWTVISELQWILDMIEEQRKSKLFPNCLDYIHPTVVAVANRPAYEAGEHGV